jgi:hypothetical protein
VKRNILFYVNDFSSHLEDWQLELLTHSHATERHYTTINILSVLRLLDLITKKIIQKENINMVPSDVLSASKQKKNISSQRFTGSLAV